MNQIVFSKPTKKVTNEGTLVSVLKGNLIHKHHNSKINWQHGKVPIPSYDTQEIFSIGSLKEDHSAMW